MDVTFSSASDKKDPPFLQGIEEEAKEQSRFDALTRKLRVAYACETALRLKLRDLQEKQKLQAAEIDHRCLNGLQRIASLLSAQSRLASPEAAAELRIAVSRIVALGNVHRRLNVDDWGSDVEIKPYLHNLCDELSSLLKESNARVAIDAESLRLPTEVASALGFVVTELITNAVKHAGGDIAARFEKTRSGYALSVSDDGPGLAPGFDFTMGKGLGMKIIQTYVGRLGGALRVSIGANGRGACFRVSFDAGRSAAG